jgi:hypothetical protein
VLPKYSSQAFLAVSLMLSVFGTMSRRWDSRTSARRAGGMFASVCFACRWLRFGSSTVVAAAATLHLAGRRGRWRRGAGSLHCTASAKLRRAVDSSGKVVSATLRSSESSSGTATYLVRTQTHGSAWRRLGRTPSERLP